MGETLRIELTEAERASWRWANVIALRFEVVEDQALVIHEEWASKSESWGDGCNVSIPMRVWAIAAPWIASHFQS